MNQNTNNDDMQLAIQKAQAVKEAHLEELMAKKNVVGVGVGVGGGWGVGLGWPGLGGRSCRHAPDPSG